MIDDNLEEFQDPILYDEENSLDEERDLFLELATQYGGPVLDVACGTGRLTIPIAETGLRCVGVDLAAPMLEHARRKSRGVPIDYVQADCRSFALGETFGFALLTGNAFQSFLSDDDQRQLLAAIAAHLRPGGGFAFETRNPAVRPLDDQPRREWERSYERPDGVWIDAHCLTRFEPATQVLHVEQHRRRRDTGADRITRIALRYSDDTHCRALLAAAGLTVVAAYGDFHRTPLTASSPQLIYVCDRA